MKKLMMITLMMCLCFVSFGQKVDVDSFFSENSKKNESSESKKISSVKDTIKNIDSLRYQLMAMRSDIDKINLNLNLHHKEFQMGTKFMVWGSLISSAGTLLYSSGLRNSYRGNNTNINLGGGMMIVGSGLLVTSSILHIDSHKYFKNQKNVKILTPQQKKERNRDILLFSGVVVGLPSLIILAGVLDELH